MPTTDSSAPAPKKPIRTTLFHRLVNPSMEREVQSRLRAMHNPMYARLARALEAQVPADATFGVFGKSCVPDSEKRAQELFSPKDKA